MHPINVTVTEDQGIPRHQEPLSFGVPLVQGQIFDPQSLTLATAGLRLSGQFDSISHWPDGSVRWVRVTTHVNVAAHDCVRFTLTVDDIDRPDPVDGPTDWITSTDTGWEVRTNTMIHSLDAATGHLKSQPLSKPELQSKNPTPCIIDSTGGGAKAAQPNQCWQLDFQLVNHATMPPGVEVADRITWNDDAGSVSATAEIEGRWLTHEQQMLAHYQCTLTFFRATGLVQVDYCLHNPRRAAHSGGLWDLGDVGSITFTELSASIICPTVLQSELTAEPLSAAHQAKSPNDAITLYQDSSGSDNWNSVNHINADGHVTTRFRGYRTISSSDVCLQGLRAQPVATVNTSVGPCSLAMRQFWQNFPSSLRASPQGLTLGLFPKESGQRYELQGGERKTHRFIIGYGLGTADLAWTASPLTPVIAAKAYADAHAFDWFYPDTPDGPLETLLSEHNQCPASLLAKRETIDEYGWRHFGDVVADHESLYRPKDQPLLVSHYNNQYDAIMAFARQFAMTGDTRWFELMDDLAWHVCDIDIYHTYEDRVEYNNGLFWHTDHYLPAQTATHRTFSQHNSTSSTPGQTGGGPGAEHCYTSGLLMHYQMTGHQPSAAAVTELAEWMISTHDGSPGLLSQVLACKKQEFPQLMRLLRRQATTPYRYPFTRGTGNYLVSLVDAYVLSDDIWYLNQASQVVRQTCHPDDDVEERQLLDVENHWSYLIMLSSLVHYLTALIQAEQPALSEEHDYAVSCLQTYTRWMLKNERPFLDAGQQLEYANDTWVAQDIRKVMLWYMASHFDPGWAPQYHATAERWLASIAAILMASPSHHIARIQVILLQQYGPHQTPQTSPALSCESQQKSAVPPAFGKRPALTAGGLLLSAGKRLLIGMRQCRPSRERAWLRSRLDRS